jgi:hypothetical protein
MSRALGAEQAVAELRQQANWQAERIAELEQTSNLGRLVRRYEAEMQRLQAQFDAERRDLQAQLAQSQTTARLSVQPSSPAAALFDPCCDDALPAERCRVPDMSAWKALFDDEQSDRQHPELQEASCQTDPIQMINPKLLKSAQKEIEHLQALNAGLLMAQTEGKELRLGVTTHWITHTIA